jgi:hypothetical protein
MSQQHYFDPLCISPNVFQNYPTLFTHIRNEHREESSLSIRCELGVFCGSRYSSFDSYRNHIYRCHRSLIDSFENNDTVSSNVDDIFDDLENLFSHFTFRNQSDFINDPESCIYPDEELDDTDREFLNFDPVSFFTTNQDFSFTKFAQSYTHFLLELREYHLLPQKVVQSISSNICSLFDMIIKLI